MQILPLYDGDAIRKLRDFEELVYRDRGRHALPLFVEELPRGHYLASSMTANRRVTHRP